MMMSLIAQQGQRDINNMYEETATIEDEWVCPACHVEGIKINNFYGWCPRDSCMGICINKDIQDVNKITIRKVENLEIARFAGLYNPKLGNFSKLSQRWKWVVFMCELVIF